MSVLTDTLNALATRVEIRTSVGPNISLDEPFAPSQSTEPSALNKFLKPTITLYSRVGDPITFAPYGDPGESKWPFVVVGGGLLLGWLAFRAFGRR